MDVEPSGSFWEFEVEGHTALIDREGYMHSPRLSILRNEVFDSESVRSLIVLSTKFLPEDESEQRTDIYVVSFLKNTEQVNSVSKASIDREFAVGLHEKTSEELLDFLSNGTSSLKESVKGVLDILERPAKSFGNELKLQLEYGLCNQQEVSQLLELIQRLKPIPPEADFLDWILSRDL